MTAAAGGGISVGRLGWPVTITAAILAAALTWLLLQWKPTARARQHRSQSDAMIIGAVTGVALIGWTAAIGVGAALAILGAALLTAPGMFARLFQQFLGRAQLGPTAESSAAGAAPEDSPRPQGRSPVAPAWPPPATQDSPHPRPAPPHLHISVQTMTDAQLCQAWRTSYVALERLLHTSDTAQQAQWINRRQQYLDELEQRHPHGFYRWLKSGARPAGDPSHYI